jgi:Zn-dependent protease
MGINVLLALMIIVSFLAAIPLHELGHVFMASWLGDYTPRAEGRQTLSLRSHIDPIGLLLCVIMAFQPLTIVASLMPSGLGWGKPVKTDPWKMRIGANAGVLAVAWAGPLFSLIIGLLTAVIARFVAPFLVSNVFTSHVLQLLVVFASVNICLAIFNLIPVYPLDGYQILYTLLPSRQAVQFARSAPYGPLIILGVFFILPFLARFFGSLGAFPLFRLAYYIWLGSMALISLVFGNFAPSLSFLLNVYIL